MARIENLHEFRKEVLEKIHKYLTDNKIEITTNDGTKLTLVPFSDPDEDDEFGFTASNENEDVEFFVKLTGGGQWL